MNSKFVMIILVLSIALLYFYSDYWKQKANEYALNVADSVKIDDVTGVITVLNSDNDTLITMTPK